MAEFTIKKIPNDQRKEIGLISDFKNTDIRQLALYDAVVLDYTDRQGCEAFIRQCRGSFIGTLYLMPIFILSLNKEIVKSVEVLSDGIISSLQVEPILSLIDKIRSKQQNLAVIDSTSPEVRIMTKFLRYMYTRETKIEPIVDHRSHIGYNYPMLSDHYENGSTQDMFKLLDNVSQNEFVRPKFVDKLHLCSDCYSSFLNFRETCPKCESLDIETENLIHHFVCAYVGPEHDFISDDYLVCPKCNRMLRHIGVDYDKPSVIYNCRNCSHTFQESVMEAFCFVCQKRNPVEALIDKPIYSYELTPIGEESAVNGFGREVKEEFDIQGFITFTTFNIFLKYEIERSKNSQKPSAVGSLILKISPEDRIKMGPSYKKLMLEMADFIKNATLSTDILSFVNNNTFLIISPNNEASDLQNLLNNIRSSMEKLLQSSLPLTPFNFDSRVIPITGTQSHTDCINQLMVN